MVAAAHVFCSCTVVPPFVELSSVAADRVRAALVTSRTLPDQAAETRS